MDQKDTLNLARAWIALQYSREPRLDDDTNLWAHSRLWDLSRTDPEACLSVIIAVVKLDGSDHILSNLAAGPLEDLLGAHGNDVIDEIEHLAGQQPAIRKMMKGVWKNNIDDEIWRRLQLLVDRS
jgi:hypothetical protein